MKLTTKIMLLLAACGIAFFLLVIGGTALSNGAIVRAVIAFVCVACDGVACVSLMRMK